MSNKLDRKNKIISKINKLPPAKRAKVLAYWKNNTEKIKEELKARTKLLPIKNIIPNIGQERALKCYQTANPDPNKYPYPKYNIFTGGNGVGKTLTAVLLLAGCALGNEFLSKDWFQFEFFDMMKERRKKKELVVWIVCKNGDMTETGSVYQEIKNQIPVAKFSSKTGGGYYTQIKIPAPKRGYHSTNITIKTFNMEVVDFSGTNCDLIIINEPLPSKEKYDECVGRIRVDGYIATFMTPLKGCAYLKKQVDDLVMRVQNMCCHTQATIWDNCKDRSGTRGHLSEKNVLAQIQEWQRDPITLKARVYGDFVHYAGAVFPIFNKSIHVIETMSRNFKTSDYISQDDMLVQGVDYHPSKPSVGVWMKLNPLGVWHVVAEYPSDPWDVIQPSEKGTCHYGNDFKLIESGKNNQFWYMRLMSKVHERFGDPNAFACKQTFKYEKKSIQDQYRDDCGLEYNIEDVNNSIEVRHDEIKSLLYYDILRELSHGNSPRLFVYDTCTNVISALSNYIWLENGKPEETWKDWIDAIGYIVTTVESYVPPKSKDNLNYDDEFLGLYEGGNPKRKQWANGWYEQKVVKKEKTLDMYSTYEI